MWVVLKECEGQPERRLKIVAPDKDPNSETFGRLTGECFFFAINKVSNAKRGNSDLLSVIDWLDTHDTFLFGINEAANLKTSAIWDITVKDATDEDLKRLEKRFGTIKKGVTRFHNDKVTIQSISPNLGTAELVEHARALKVHIASGLGLPEHWLAEGGNANRATAAEMGVPTTKRLRSRQIFFRNMVASIFEFVIDQAIIASVLKPDVSREFTVFAPQIWAVDTVNLTTSLGNATSALQVAEDMGWVTQDEAKLYWHMIAQQLGIHLAGSSPTGEEPPPGPVTEATRKFLEDQYAKRLGTLAEDLAPYQGGERVAGV
jgi:hypothetical protein